MTTYRTTAQTAASDSASIPPKRGLLRFFAYLGPEGPIALVRGRALARREAARTRRRV